MSQLFTKTDLFAKLNILNTMVSLICTGRVLTWIINKGFFV